MTMPKINCGGDWLVDYADGALAEPERDAADAHLAACDNCRRELGALRTSGNMLIRHFGNLRTSAAGLPARSKTWSLVARGVAAVAAVLILVVIGYALSRGGPAKPPPREIVREVTPPSVDVTADDDFLAEINREGQIARLRATIALLKDEPGMAERRESLRQYLLDSYQVAVEDMPSM